MCGGVLVSFTASAVGGGGAGSPAVCVGEAETLMGCAHGKACTRMRTRGLAAHAGEYHEYSHDTLDTPSAHAGTVSTHSHWAVELPAHVAVRRTHWVLGVLAIL